MKRYAAVIRISEQCSPDDFEWNTYIKEIQPGTQIADLLDWQKTIFKHIQSIRDGEFFYPMMIQPME